MSSMRYSRHFGCPNRKNAPVHLAQRRNPMREYEDRSLDVTVIIALYLTISLFSFFLHKLLSLPLCYQRGNTTSGNALRPHSGMYCWRKPAGKLAFTFRYARAHTHLSRPKQIQKWRESKARDWDGRRERLKSINTPSSATFPSNLPVAHTWFVMGWWTQAAVWQRSWRSGCVGLSFF